MMKKSTTRRALAALICGIAAFALTALLAGCGNEEDALPEENVKYEIALVTDDSLVMDGGHIESVGTHEELLVKSPIYREVYESQNKGGDKE